MGIGREVADAYIDVHGDLSSFRRDLNDLSGAEDAAIKNADKFTKAWADRIESDVNGKWSSIVDAMYSDKKIDWDQLIGAFDGRSLEDANDKIVDFLEKMRAAGKLTQTQFEDAKKAIDGQIDSLRESNKLLDRQEQETRGLGMATDANRKLFAEANAENEKWARTFEGMFKNNRLGDIENDFKGIARAMNDMDWSKFAKGFDSLAAASRRVREINSLMHEQGRISNENADAIQRSIDAYILSEKEKSKAMKDALDETNRLKKAQDEYNQSLRGMSRNFHFAELENQFRRLAAAIDSNDWSHFAKGSENAKEMQFRISEVAAEMHRLGRMSDQELSMVYRRAKEASGSFKELSGETERLNKAMESTSSSGGGGGKFRKLLGGLGDATRGLREHLGGFAGLNVFGDMIDKGLNFIHNLDRIAVSVGKNTLALGSMAALGASAFGGLITLAGDLGGVVGGLAVALPAFAVGAGIGVGVLIAAMKDMKTVLKDLKPAFEELQNQISSSFWKVAAGPIREMVKTLMPILTPKLKGTATALGGLVGKLATAFKNIPAAKINGMFDRMNGAIDILGGAMSPLIKAFTTLGDVGSQYFKRFSTWIVTLSNQFNDFIQKSAKNGDLNKWIDNMIEGFKNIGRAIDGAFGIFNALDTAARNAGFGGLKTFADALQRAAEIMQTKEFQSTLTTYLEGARDLALKLGEAIYDLGPAFQSFAPTAKTALGDIGDAVQKIIGYVGDIFTNPTFQQGVRDFTSSLDTAIGRLQPAIKPFSDSLGNALTLLGKIAISVADVATAMIVNWTPVLDSISAKLENLITPMKNAVVKAIEDLTPILEGIDKNIVQPLVDALTEKGGLIDVLTGQGGLTEKIGEVGAALTNDLSAVIKPLVGEGGVLSGMVKVVGELLGPLGALFNLFTPTLQSLLEGIGAALNNLANDIKVLKGEVPFEGLSFFKRPTDEEIKAKMNEELRIQSWGEILAELLTGQIPRGIAQAAEKIWTEGIAPWLAGIWGNLVTSWNNAWSGNGLHGTEQGKKQGEEFVNGWNGFWEDYWKDGGPLTKWQQETAKWLKTIDWGQVAEDLFNGFIQGVTKLSPQKWKEIAEGFTGWVKDVLAFFGIKSPSTLMFDIASDIVQGFLDGFGEFATKVGEKWEEIKTTLALKFEEIKTNLNLWIEERKTDWTNFWGSFGETIALKWEEIKAALALKWEEITTSFNLWIEARKLDWTNFWGSFGQTIATKWEEFKLTLATKWEEITTGINLWIEARKLDWTNFWTTMGTIVQTKWEEFKKTISTKYEEIKTNINSFIEQVKTNWNNFWETVRRKVEEIWNFIPNFISQKFAEAKRNIDRFIGEVKVNWDNFWRGVGERLSRAWEELRRGVETGIKNIVAFFTNLPSQVTAALSAFSLFTNGASILQGLWDGMVAKWNEMTAWISGLAGWIAANKGPIEYDRKLLEPAGVAIMSGLDKGLRRGIDPLLNTLQTITAAVTDSVTADLSKSVMYATGRDAAQGLADGLKANRTAVHTAIGNLGAFTVPSSSITVGGSFAPAVGRTSADATAGRSVTIAEGAIKIETPTKSPELVAAKVIDGFVNYSTF